VSLDKTNGSTVATLFAATNSVMPSAGTSASLSVAMPPRRTLF
jgi:hypothetical protein